MYLDVPMKCEAFVRGSRIVHGWISRTGTVLVDETTVPAIARYGCHKDQILTKSARQRAHF